MLICEIRVKSAQLINMPQEAVLECTGKCQMVNTYKTINRALTTQNSEFKEALALKNKENLELHELVMELRAEIAELKKKPENVSDTIQVVAMATEAFASITQTVQTVGAKLACFNNKLLHGALSETNTSNVSPIRTLEQNRTPTNVSRIRPIIRTPNGLMQTVSISLPRIDHSRLFSAAERMMNSTTVSENGHTSATSNEETVQSEGNSEEVSETEPTVNGERISIPDTTRDLTVVPSTSTRGPRRTDESPFLGFEESEIESQPNPELIPAASTQDMSYYEGLSVIQEVTEVDYTVNPSHVNGATTEDESSGGEEIASHQTSKVSLRANKENTLRSQNMSISQASCSTPYNNRQERSADMKIAKVVLRQMNMEEIKLSQKSIARTRNDSESSEQSIDDRAVTLRKPAGGRKRKDSEMSVNTDDTDDESSTGRPKRRATPTSFKEPTLKEKLRRPK